MKPVEIVEIIELIPIFRDGLEATSIQVAHFKYSNGDPCGYHLIVGKGLYNIGDSAIYIQPDYCVSSHPIFSEYIAPNGDPSKSKLGKKGRIKAIKFNFNFTDSLEPIYSSGILIPFTELSDRLKESEDLTTELGIIKYEADEPSTMNMGLTARDLPTFLYMTDEETYQNRLRSLHEVIGRGEVLTISNKRDGSSASIYFKKSDVPFDISVLHMDQQKELEGLTINYTVGVCSRKQEKRLDQIVVNNYILPNGNQLSRHYDKETEQKGWFDVLEGKFYTNGEVIGLESITSEVRDSWVDVAKNSRYIIDGLLYCIKNDLELVLRGELIGRGLKGSGNKNNPDISLEPQIILFGIDD